MAANINNGVFLVARRRGGLQRQNALPALGKPRRDFGVNPGEVELLKPWQSWRLPIIYEESDHRPLDRKRKYNHIRKEQLDPEIQDITQLFGRFSLYDQQPLVAGRPADDSSYETRGMIRPDDKIYDAKGVAELSSKRRRLI